MKTFVIATAASVTVAALIWVVLAFGFTEVEMRCADLGGRLIVSLSGTAYCIDPQALIQPQ